MQPAARSDHGAADHDGPLEVEARAPDPLIGRVVADRYRIVGHLGRGGMGVVYKVEHLRIGKLMAMTLLSGELSRNKEVVRRFKREALAASRLTSINTVQVWDFGHSDGLTYLVMELVAGEDLGRILKREGPMPFKRVAQIAVQVCNSMIEAHDRGIVHRDIKPENILLVHPGGKAPDPSQHKSDGVQDLVKVLDFGLAKLHDDERPHTNEVTTTGAIVGTPFYMSPEQIRGEPVDGRADLYALGAVMSRAITGVPPFTAATPMAVLTQHLTEELVPPHERAPELAIPREASDIIARAMAKDRDARFASAAELREALIQYLAGLGVSSGFLRSGALEAVAPSLDPAALERIRPSRGVAERPVPATRREVRSWFRERRRRALFGFVAVTALALAGIVVAFSRRAPDPGPIDAEREANDTIDAANPLVLGAPKRAHLGKRLGPDKPDVDWFRFDAPASEAGPLVEIGLAPLPNIPLCVELHSDPSGDRPRAAFCRPRGRPLHVAAFRMEPGTHWLRVTQDRGPSEEGARPPVHENVSDTYALRVALAPHTSDLEIEPNDGVSSAQQLDLDHRVVGRIGWRGDRDVFCAAPESRAKLVVADRTTGLESQLVITSAVGGSSGELRGPAKPLDPKAGLAVDVAPGERRCVMISARTEASAMDATYEVSLVAR